MEWLVVWLGLAIVVGVAANTRGRLGLGWFLLAVITSPLIAGLLVLALPRLSPPAVIALSTPPPGATKVCPYCAETIQHAAIVCRYCGRDLAAKQTSAESETKPSHQHGAIAIGDGSYRFEVVGESHYQNELEQIVGERTEDGAEQECVAILVPEPDNSYDSNAVQVRVDGQKVGYLSREHAAWFKAQLANAGYSMAACRALIVGGWDRGPNDRGHFGVKLDITLPLKFESVSDELPKPTSRTQTVRPIMRMLTVSVVVAALVFALWTTLSNKRTMQSTPLSVSSGGSELQTPRSIQVEVPLPRQRPVLRAQ